MFIFEFLAYCFIQIFACLNTFVFPGTNIGFGTIIVALTMLAAIFKFISMISNTRISLDSRTSNSSSEVSDEVVFTHITNFKD